MTNSNGTAAAHVKQVIESASRGLVERRLLVELVVLAAVAREHVLVIGPPGTAKSQAVRAISRQFGGAYFEYLLGRFTEPTDIFGAVDLAKLRTGEVAVQTAGMLPEAEIVFLDEVFLGSNAILNTLLALLNERKFIRGHTRQASPLRVCVGASNALPEEASLEAFADRFLLRVFVEPLPDEMLETLLEAGWGSSLPEEEKRHGSLVEIDQLARQAQAMDLSGVRVALADSIRSLRAAGVMFGDRRIVKTQKLVAAAAALRGAEAPGSEDLWPLIYCASTAEEQVLAREVLAPKLAQSRNASLLAAAEDASQAPAARAERMAHDIDELMRRFDQKPPRLPAEAILREVSAAFGNDVPPSLIDPVASLSQVIEQQPLLPEPGSKE